MFDIRQPDTRHPTSHIAHRAFDTRRYPPNLGRPAFDARRSKSDIRRPASLSALELQTKSIAPGALGRHRRMFASARPPFATRGGALRHSSVQAFKHSIASLRSPTSRAAPAACGRLPRADCRS
ncbi:hypothetical protein WS83_13035 [Burkholderia sp. MSMB2042]|nr:hypothetical protein WS77_13935 [Burkholderia sp. MSMB0265]KVG90836.1 hypothetical protein WS82_16050 [Burkholderia sp. MSMB2041]KVG91562.1 hypothetical protein WS83_13035 [Burkholderia sp. MSMB2042]